MTTQNQDQWAQYLEDATQKEIMQMAEYAIDHIEKRDELAELQFYLAMAIEATN
jgi:hypothetical protein